MPVDETNLRRFGVSNMTREQHSVIIDILEERDRQKAKWGDQVNPPFLWLAVLTEEVGELSQALLHNLFGGKAKGTAYKELVQVAAVCVAWMEHWKLDHLDKT